MVLGSLKEKLSRLFSSSSHSPTSQDPHQAESTLTKEMFPPKRSFFSSFFLSFLPRGCSDGSNLSPRSSPLQSLSKRSKENSFPTDDNPLDCITDSRNDTNFAVDGIPREDLHHVSPSNSNGLPRVEKASTSCNSAEFLSCLSEKSTFVSADLFAFLQSSLPNIVKGCKWTLFYSTVKHGISLQTLLRKSVDISGPCLLIAGDMQGAIFGGLLDGPLKPTGRRKYLGTSQTFVFTTIYGEPRLFRATGANRYYYLCVNDLLAFGGGSSFALSLEENLLHGTSGPSETFGNLCLAHGTEFELKNVELWCFSHSSHYLT